nr:reverse transcriptase domain-containing protein [Tanacetum cinerariifolium]
MEKLCQPTLNGRGGPIAPFAIQANDFGLKHHMIQQVQNSCQFHGLSGDDENKHLDKFLHITQSMKQNGVTDDALRLYLFPYSLTHHATAWFNRFPGNSFLSFDQMATKFLSKYFPPSMVTKLRNEITNFYQLPDESLFEAWEHYKLSIDQFPYHNMLLVTQIDTFYNGLTLRHRDNINATAGATNFRLKNDMIQQVQNSCQFHGLSGDDAKKHLDKFLHVTQSIKVNGVTDDALHLYLFPHSLTHHVTAWFDCLPRNSINTFEKMAKMFIGKYFPPSMVTKLRNEITNFRQRPDESLFEAWERYKLSIDRFPDHNMLPVTQIDTFYNGLTLRHRDTINAAAATVGQTQNVYAARAYNPGATVGQTQNVYAARAYNPGGNSYQPHGTLPSNTITNPKKDLKGITTRSRNAYKGLTIPTTSSPPKIVECETKVTKNTVPPTNNGSTKDVQPSVIQVETPILNSELVVAPVSAPKPNQKPSIPYPSRLHDQKLRDKANEQKEKFLQIFKDLDFNISFADALILLPKDPGKFLILCGFPGMDECLALADLGTSINLMPLFVWNKLSLLELTPTLMTLELANRSISRPIGVAEDVFVKTGRALIDVYARELTLRVNNEAVTCNLDQTSRYSTNYNDMTANRIDVIDMACEEYSQELLNFYDVIASGNPIPYYDPIVSTSCLTLIPFEDSDFLLEEVDAFLALADDPTSPEVDHSYYDEPPEVELKDLPPYLEYAYLEGDDKLPVIITKYLVVEEKADLIKVLKSHKRAIAWKLFDIKAIDSEFCTHKILMEDVFKPAAQHQRRSLGKSRTLRTKKSGFTVVGNEENELIPTRLVTGGVYVLTTMYYTFSKILKNFDRLDLEVLWRLVKDRFIKSKPVDDMDSFLLHTLKSMFEHHVEDN